MSDKTASSNRFCRYNRSSSSHSTFPPTIDLSHFIRTPVLVSFEDIESHIPLDHVLAVLGGKEHIPGLQQHFETEGYEAAHGLMSVAASEDCVVKNVVSGSKLSGYKFNIIDGHLRFHALSNLIKSSKAWKEKSKQWLVMLWYKKDGSPVDQGDRTLIAAQLNLWAPYRRYAQ